jgi:uncharacterized membrane protein
MRLHKRYLAAFFLLLATEIFIALFVHDKIFRPYVGDILVVILLYALVRSFSGRIRFLPASLFSSPRWWSSPNISASPIG